MLDPDTYETVDRIPKDGVRPFISATAQDVVTFKLQVAHSDLKNIEMSDLKERLEEGIQDGLDDSFDERINMADFTLIVQIAGTEVKTT